jgi:hypothetical protein
MLVIEGISYEEPSMNNPTRHAIRLGLAAVITVGVVGAASARPDTRSMTCAQTQKLIVRNGAIVLTTGRHTYDRYVASARFCSLPDVPTLTSVQTKDTGQCPVYNCQRAEPIFEDMFRP